MAKKRVAEKPVEDLDEEEAAAAWQSLTDEIAEYDKAYFQEDAPIVSDAEYDRLRRRVLAIEARFPKLKSAVSVSVGRGALGEVRQGRPPRADAVARQRLRRGGCGRVPGAGPAFPARAGRGGHRHHSPSRRSMACPARSAMRSAAGQRRHARRRLRGRERHRPISAPSRGVPHELPAKAPDIVEVRGEVYMTHAEFRALNERLEKERAEDDSPIRETALPARSASSTRRSPHRGRSTSSPMPGAR